jgi:subtilisin family serine protease
MSIDLGCWLDDCSPVEDALGRLRERGLILVAAAGNDGGDACSSFPGGSSHVVAVQDNLRPSQALVRGEAVAMLWRAAGSP